MPKDFSLANQSDEDTELVTATRNNHKRMVDLVQENFHKQYVQGFLKDNLIDFLEKYEGLIQSNTFSYAAVWERKESYLKRLFEATQIGLRSESPYAMYREGESWKIVFNGKATGGLRGKGFRWIYYIISAPGQKTYCRQLHDLLNDSVQKEMEDFFDEKEKKIKGKEKKNFASMDGLSLSNGGSFTDENDNEFEVYKNAYNELLHKKQLAEMEGNTLMVEKRLAQISVLFGYMDENNILYEIKGDEIEFKKSTYIDTNYKTINDKIKKSWS